MMLILSIILMKRYKKAVLILAIDKRISFRRYL